MTNLKIFRLSTILTAFVSAVIANAGPTVRTFIGSGVMHVNVTSDWNGAPCEVTLTTSEESTGMREISFVKNIRCTQGSNVYLGTIEFVGYKVSSTLPSAISQREGFTSFRVGTRRAYSIVLNDAHVSESGVYYTTPYDATLSFNSAYDAVTFTENWCNDSGSYCNGVDGSGVLSSAP